MQSLELTGANRTLNQRGTERCFSYCRFPGPRIYFKSTYRFDGSRKSIEVGNVPRDEVGKFLGRFFKQTPELNNYRTIDEFWRENSYGKWGVELESFGTYRMDITNSNMVWVNGVKKPTCLPDSKRTT